MARPSIECAVFCVRLFPAAIMAYIKKIKRYLVRNTYIITGRCNFVPSTPGLQCNAPEMNE